jgi:sialate O-acetylesterase
MKRLLAAVLPLLALVLASPARADDRPFLSPMFTSNMVLQRGIADPVWGWTSPGQEVSVRIHGKTARAVADADGKWMARVGPLPTGGPYTMTVSGPQNVELSNILVGDVWVCSGQSNMEMGIGNVNQAKEEIAAANYPKIRLFTVAKSVATEPRTSLSGKWDVCTPETVAAGGWNGFSAVAYFFGRELHRQLNIPIGLIHTSWGGTIAEAWTSAEALDTMPDFQNAVSQVNLMRRRGVTATPGNNPNVATVLYNGMIAPVIPYGIKGAIWYQGESNAGRAYQYRTLLPTMINDWRSRWGVGDFPFYIVQLANFTPLNAQPVDSDWAELREAQSMTAASLPNAGIAVTTDIGDAADIHPKNKQEVGRRLALDALANTYGKKVEYSGPAFRSMKREGNKIRLRFSHARGLTARGGQLQGFSIAGADRKFVWADAVIEGDSVVVSSPQASSPVAVRYGWSNNPPNNLYNAAGLPASPFRTDDWPGVTVARK